MSIKEGLKSKGDPKKGYTCKTHSDEPPEEEKGSLKGVVCSYRRIDGLPVIETDDGLAVILKEFTAKPEIGEEVAYVITVRHGNVMYGKRVGD